MNMESAFRMHKKVHHYLSRDGYGTSECTGRRTDKHNERRGPKPTPTRGPDSEESESNGQMGGTEGTSFEEGWFVIKWYI